MLGAFRGEQQGRQLVSDDFEDFYRANARRVQAVLAVGGVQPQDAADVCADAFIRAWERWDRVKMMDHPVAWVTTTALNLNRRRFHRADREVLVGQAPASMGRSDVMPDVDLAQAIGRLSRRQREVVLLRYGLDLSEAACAEALGIRPGTASATLAQARRRLATLLAPVQIVRTITSEEDRI